MTAITATPDPAFGRIRVEVTGATAPVVLTASQAGSTRSVRGGDPLPANGVALDYEYLPGRPITYTASDAGGAVSADPLPPPAETASWLIHPFLPFLSAPVRIVDEIESEWDGRGAEFDVLSRRSPVVVTAPMGTRHGAVRFAAALGPERDALRLLLANGAVLYLRPACDLIEAGRYLYVRSAAERWTRGRTRIIEVSYRAVERPPGGLQFDPTRTYADLLAAHGTYAEVRAAYGTYLDVLTEGVSAGPPPLLGW